MPAVGHSRPESGAETHVAQDGGDRLTRALAHAPSSKAVGESFHAHDIFGEERIRPLFEHVLDRDGHLPSNPARRFGFTSLDAMAFGAARQVRISLGREVRPGDFVATTGLSSLRLTLRLYSPTLAARAPGRDQLPSVTPLGCDQGAAS